jgi:hypothetical protein
MLLYAGKPVIFCFVAWMSKYDGPKSDDPIWLGVKAPNGIYKHGDVEYFLSESFLFRKLSADTGELIYLGYVEHDFSTQHLGGDDDSAIASVVWCAADPNDDGRIKVVGYYRDATIYSQRQGAALAVNSKSRAALGSQVVFRVRGASRVGKTNSLFRTNEAALCSRSK